MSGGVDSSVAASLLQQQGYDVTGVFMCMGLAAPDADPGEPGKKVSCCSPDAVEDARRIARQLHLPFYVLDFSRQFDAVIEYFAAEYARGRTPNPCAKCNQWLKFGHVLRYADAAGARYVATGHHARIEPTDTGPAIFRARDRRKDQSYVLFGLPRKILSRVRLPIGDVADKAEVRRIARQLDLRVADKPDSQDVCFVGDEGYADILRQRAPGALRPGPILDRGGREVGRHNGIGRFTIGQRRGLGVAAGTPVYVTAIEPESATVTIGPRPAAAARRLLAGGANWHVGPEHVPARGLVQIRYNHEARPAMLRRLDDARFEATFDEPIHAVTPGQIAAVYDGDRLLGGGWIERCGDGADCRDAPEEDTP